METLLELETSAQDIREKKQINLYTEARKSSFASRMIGKGVVIVYYYGALVFSMVTKIRQRTRNYRDVVLQVTTGTLRKWKNEQLDKIMDEEGSKNRVWIVAAQFSAMRYISDDRYL